MYVTPFCGVHFGVCCSSRVLSFRLFSIFSLSSYVSSLCDAFRCLGRNFFLAAVIVIVAVVVFVIGIVGLYQVSIDR